LRPELKDKPWAIFPCQLGELFFQRRFEHQGKEQNWESMSLKIGGDCQSRRQILVQQDMAWYSVRIVRVMDMSGIQNANVALSVGALDLLKRIILGLGKPDDPGSAIAVRLEA